jgi:hypothetical protein
MQACSDKLLAFARRIGAQLHPVQSRSSAVQRKLIKFHLLKKQRLRNNVSDGIELE